MLQIVRASGAKVERRLLSTGSWNAHLTITTFPTQGGFLPSHGAEPSPKSRRGCQKWRDRFVIGYKDLRTSSTTPTRSNASCRGLSQRRGSEPGVPRANCVLPFSPTHPCALTAMAGIFWLAICPFPHDPRAARAAHDRSGRRRQVTTFLPVHSRRWAIAAWFPEMGRTGNGDGACGSRPAVLCPFREP